MKRSRHVLAAAVMGLTLVLAGESLSRDDVFRPDLQTGLAAYDAGDYQTAWQHWEALAQNGNITAQTAIADLWHRGHGRPANIARAYYWYRRAAVQGGVTAQIALAGRASRMGEFLRAFVWFTLAAKSGNDYASAQALGLRRKLSNDTIRGAERQLRAFQPRGENAPAE